MDQSDHSIPERDVTENTRTLAGLELLDTVNLIKQNKNFLTPLGHTVETVPGPTCRQTSKQQTNNVGGQYEGYPQQQMWLFD
jgi:hypothetical protein